MGHRRVDSKPLPPLEPGAPDAPATAARPSWAQVAAVGLLPSRPAVPASGARSSAPRHAPPRLDKPTVAWVDPRQVRQSQASVSWQKCGYDFASILSGLRNTPCHPRLTPDVVQFDGGERVTLDNTRIAAGKLLGMPRQRVRLVSERERLPDDQRGRFSIVDAGGRRKTPHTYGEAAKFRIEASHHGAFSARYPIGSLAVPAITGAPRTATWKAYTVVAWRRPPGGIEVR